MVKTKKEKVEVYFPETRQNIIAIPDTPIDLKTGVRGDIDYQFSKRLRKGIVEYSESTHKSLEECVKDIWRKMRILDYPSTQKLPNPYISLKNTIQKIERTSRMFIGVGRSSLPFLLYLVLNTQSFQNTFFIYMTTKWEKTGRMLENSRINVVYTTIEHFVKKIKPNGVFIIDDVMATGYTMKTIYRNLRSKLGKNIEIYLLPVMLDIHTLLISNLSNGGRNIRPNKIDDIIEKQFSEFYYSLPSKDWTKRLKEFSKNIGGKYNKGILEELANLLSHTYPSIVINSRGGEVFPVTHLIRDTEEEASNKGIYNENKTLIELRDLQAMYFQNPLLHLLDEYKNVIKHAPRSV